ncbi:MAG: 2Fe-2S iron-sulfur cluster-binding protein [Burkholderiaceae bacterium]
MSIIRCTLIDASGVEHTIEAQNGESLMQAAVRHDVDGIAADCGGTLACATCHVRVQAPWQAQLPATSDDERAMLDFTAEEADASSRLSCQLILSDALDGLVVKLPAAQH